TMRVAWKMLLLDDTSEAEIGGGRHPHGRPDPRLALVVGCLAADHADEVDEAATPIGARDGAAVVLAEAALQHLIARHADANDEVVADRSPHRFQYLEAEAHPVPERAAIAVAPLVHGRRPELLDQRAGLARDLDPVEITIAGAADRGGEVVADALDVVILHHRREGAVDHLSQAGWCKGREPVVDVPALASAAVGELH